MTVELDVLTAKIQQANETIKQVRQQISKVIIGQQGLIDSLLIGILADGHLLLEGLPGLAKTLAVNTFAKVMQCDFKRVQFTPDLLPADLIGTSIYSPKEGTFSVNKGPIFTNILLADEINRAPPKVQSALLEVMQEKQVTISGQTFKTGNPYAVLATQNPIEQEGTYPLPEAQTDRFLMKILIDYPTMDEEKEIMLKMGALVRPEAEAVMSADEILAFRRLANDIFIDEKIVNYILQIVFATRTPQKFNVDIAGLLLFGASPRASLGLKAASKARAFLQGRAFVTPQDVKVCCLPVLRHRLRLSYEAEAENITADDVIERILNSIPVP